MSMDEFLAMVYRIVADGAQQGGALANQSKISARWLNDIDRVKKWQAEMEISRTIPLAE